jgi:hypothetical protein
VHRHHCLTPSLPHSLTQSLQSTALLPTVSVPVDSPCHTTSEACKTSEWVSECICEWVSVYVGEWVLILVGWLVYDWMSEWVNEWVSKWVNKWQLTSTHSREYYIFTLQNHHPLTPSLPHCLTLYDAGRMITIGRSGRAGTSLWCARHVWGTTLTSACRSMRWVSEWV